MENLTKCEANYAQLTPITFLERAAKVYSNRTSIIYYGKTFTWAQTYDRCRRLASSLKNLNIKKMDVVSVLAPNIPAVYEMHFAVPMAGAVLNTINTRLDSAGIALILKHAQSKAFFVDYQYVRLAADALQNMVDEGSEKVPLVVVIDDLDKATGTRLGELEYERLVAAGDSEYRGLEVEDEWDPISLNYTSGTTSAPKGVVYSHRGAYLSTITLLLQWGVESFPVYLWSLPMFHCNGWTFTWGMAARGGTNVCIRSSSAAEMYGAITAHKVTHMCCAPIIFNILLDKKYPQMPHPIHVLTGGAPPPAALLQKIERLGFRVTHAYGLTEATGPAMVCEWQPEWNNLPSSTRSTLKQRQGISVLTLSDSDVKDRKTLTSVPKDGKTMGEIVLRGSTIMKGYYKNESDTSAAFNGGWFWTGDVGVVHPDGYVEIKDRSKDVIISGGENISSMEVENVLYSHPNIAEAAVVAMDHPFWGESPCAFVRLTGGDERKVEEEELMAYCRSKMAKFMVPKKVVIMEVLPKTSTGKILKFRLREMAKEFRVSDDHKIHNTKKASSSSSSPVSSSAAVGVSISRL